MKFYDYLIIIIPVAFVLFMGWYSGKKMRGVIDFLASGRLCGRYMLTASYDAQAMSVITLIASMEIIYQTGFAMSIWYLVLLPFGMLLTLTGFAFYRFRETKALSLGQFLEMRYNKVIRFYGASLRTFSDIIINSMGPAISARFFIYFLDLPHTINVGSYTIPTYSLVLVIVLIFALLIIWWGGQLAVNVTDTVQVLICYPVLIVFAIFIISYISWDTQVAPVLQNRVYGESFINPFEILQIRDFNIFNLFVVFIGMFLNKANYVGGGIHGSARSPHEQKMGNVIATWRSISFGIFIFLVSILLITVFNNRDFAPKAHTIRGAVVNKISDEIIDNSDVKDALKQHVTTRPVVDYTNNSKPLSRRANLDTQELSKIHNILLESEKSGQQITSDNKNANSIFQEFQTLYFQTSIPVMLRTILPAGFLGLLCMIMVLMMISTDDSRILYNSMTVVQDLILPFKKAKMSPKNHILLLRTVSVIIGGLFFLLASVLAQLDFISLFINIIASIWTGAAGAVIIGGLYTRFGTSFGAFCSLFIGGGFALCGALIQRFWSSNIYPWLENIGQVDNIGAVFHMLSAPLDPIIIWEMNPLKFPINSIEWSLLTMFISCSCYIIGSWATYKKPFNLEKMLHREEKKVDAPKEKKSLIARIVSISPEYTKGDRIIAWSVFYWSIGYSFVISFIMVVVWNLISPWSKDYWTNWLFITMLCVPMVVTVILCVWFSYGGIKDLKRLFYDLKHEPAPDDNDNGQI